MHTTIILYLVMWVAIISCAKGPDLKIANFRWPKTTLATYSLLICLHLYAIVAPAPRRRPCPFNMHSRMWRTWTSSLRHMAVWMEEYQDEFFIVFNVVEIACQSHQAYAYFDEIAQPSKAISYLSIVITYSFFSPLILFVRNTRAKTTLINLADSIFSFALSCGLPILAVVLTTLDYVMVNQALGRDNLWATNVALIVRLLAITNAFDYVCKLAMHLGTFIALVRFVQSLDYHETIGDKDPIPTDIPAIASSRKHLLLRVNLWVNVSWGCILTFALSRSLASHHPCPSYCIADIRPLLDDTCQCAYANINCVTLNTTDPTELLHPDAIGTRLLLLQISRCDIPSGLPPAALAPFEHLGRIMLLYTNMETWNGPLPPSIFAIFVRHSCLQAIPHALQVDLPPNIVSLYLEGSPISVIPDAVVAAWANLERLYLMNLSLQTLPESLTTTLTLWDVDFRLNNLTTLPKEWVTPNVPSLSHLKLAYFGGNPLPDAAAPWHLAQRGIPVDLSGTRISRIPTSLGGMNRMALTKRQVVLDDTPYCLSTIHANSFCKPLCAPGCFANMRGDFYCDLACFTPACGFDGGDCDDMGFDVPG
ncbi:Aste57867_16395 [Aphanomyces stellatus]|uniref:Aste57867_16395 protein n=1 Tax=Aphanomyces stellatus TaxID=120398 RepID=A0A485L5C7_9STRA|nr:hypothetical protein As57867_016338 [Aphanomyces stellatus]VFT93171.1 Aste57867_16395 [Aphanomyces stellatus]